MRFVQMASYAALAVAAIVIPGCGPKYLPVRGQVTLADGSPLGFEGIIVVEPVDIDKKENRYGGRGNITNAGTYRISTRRPGDGLPAGKYKVLIVPPVFWDDMAKGTTTHLTFHPKYSEFETSGLTMEVGPGATEFDFKLDPNPAFRKS